MSFRLILKTALGIVLTLLVLVVFQVARSTTAAELLPPVPGALRVATYNVHYINLRTRSGDWGVEDWNRRKEPMSAAFRAMQADVVAFQEMESFAGGDDDSVNLARDWLLAQNPGYAAAAVGDWRTFPSTQPIFYRADKLRVEDQGWFFFSNTPDVIYSRTFNGSWPAFASWAKFRSLMDGETFYVFNMHFEYKSWSNRKLSAELVARRIAPLVTAGERVILAGDLNARLGSATLKILERAGLKFLPVKGATYHFNKGLNLFGAIDHVAFSGGVDPVGKPVVLQRRFHDEWPTDHYPVIADFRFR